MKRGHISRISALVLAQCSVVSAGLVGAHAQSLDSFAVLAGSTVTNTGPSVINGNVGVSPGTAIVGFDPPGIVTAPYTIYVNDGVAVQAQSDLVAAYTGLSVRPPTVNLTGQDLGGLTLGPGVYTYDSSAQLTGTLTLDAKGNPNAVFIIKSGSTLTTASASNVVLVNGAQAGNVFFVVGSSATLGTDTTFNGEILALTSITLNTGADITCGAALARNGAVTLDTNTISVCPLKDTTVTDVLPPGTTPNAGAVGGAIDKYLAGGGTLPPAFLGLAVFLTSAQLEAALVRLSGELGTAVAPAGMQSMNGFLWQVFNQLGDESGPLPEAVPSGARATVKALGYAAPARPGASPFDKAISAPQVDARLWTVWAAAYGADSTTDADAFGGHARSISSYGIAAGLDYRITPDAKIGVAISGGSNTFSLGENFGSGTSDVLQAAIYGRMNFNAAYVSAALAYGWNDVTTERFLDFAPGSLSSEFSAYNLAGRVEAGYRFPLPSAPGDERLGWFTPYAAVQVQSFRAPAYSETGTLTAAAFALSYAENTTTMTSSELGAKIGRVFVLENDATLALRTRFAWVHNYSTEWASNAAFLALPGSAFTVYGTQSDADMLLASAGAEIRLASGFAVSGVFDALLSDNAQTYAGTARLSYSW